MQLGELWDNIFSNQTWGKYPAEVLIRFVAKNFYKQDRQKIKILEVGCGPGPNLWYLAREGFQAYGIDISSTAIERAQQRLTAEGFNADLKVGDIKSLPYPDGTFAAVIDNECLYCNTVADTNVILKEVARVLKKGGLFFSRTFSDQVHLGSKFKQVSKFEYDEVLEGPFVGKGFARVIDRAAIHELYGKYFELVTVDLLEYTVGNGAQKVSEWVIIAKKQ